MFRRGVNKILLFMVMNTTAFAALHDPTRPPGSGGYLNESTAGDLRVQAIYISPHKKRVIIGGRDLTIGDEIMGAEIVSIDTHEVTLHGRQGKFIIEIFRPIIKKRVPKNGERL
jgi:hypothetical protein